MIVRIVRMEFQEENLDTFHKIFDESKSQIRHFPGCYHLEILKDSTYPHIRYTYSIWENEASLEAYRNSGLFASVWQKTKVLFSGKAQAWSMEPWERID
ncbi:MAG: antibiotic biosynthesis monooxygenase family protein [Bacteroidia bacterium]|nr:antibiotic biosynthesis monooxygenase family protein [Bacteroidia bacterium]